MEQIDRIKRYKRAAKEAVIGSVLLGVGFTFDYKIIDDIMRIGGTGLVGYNLLDTIFYVQYLLKR